MSSSNLSLIKTCNILDKNVNTVIGFPSAPGYIIVFLTLAVICAMITLTTICLNACAVVTIWATPSLREKVSNFSIMMQSSVDFLNGLFVMPFFTYSLVSEISGSSACLPMYICKKMAVLAFFSSITAFAVMNYERYMVICHPLLHRTRVTKKRLCKCFIVVFSLQTLALGFTVYFILSRLLFGFVCLVFLAHTVFTYTKIARAIQNKIRHSRLAQNAEGRSKIKQYLTEIKATKTCFLIVVCCIGCYLPSVLLLSGMISPKNFFVKVILIRSFGVITMLNSTLNSLILFWRNKKLRIHAKICPKCNTR